MPCKENEEDFHILTLNSIQSAFAMEHQAAFGKHAIGSILEPVWHRLLTTGANQRTAY
jgi:hypothetical protein